MSPCGRSELDWSAPQQSHKRYVRISVCNTRTCLRDVVYIRIRYVHECVQQHTYCSYFMMKLKQAHGRVCECVGTIRLECAYMRMSVSGFQINQSPCTLHTLSICPLSRLIVLHHVLRSHSILLHVILLPCRCTHSSDP